MEKSREVTDEPVVGGQALRPAAISVRHETLWPPAASPTPLAVPNPPAHDLPFQDTSHELCTWKWVKVKAERHVPSETVPPLKKKTNLPASFILLISAHVSLERMVSSGYLGCK